MPSTSPPPFFSWVVMGKLAAHGFPSTASEVKYLEEVGIRHVVTLTRVGRPLVEAAPGIDWTFISIEDYTPPTIKQVLKFIEVVELGSQNNEAVSVHCYRGRGRTGTMLACYFVKYEKISAQEAIKKVRDLRPGSVETEDQEHLVEEFAECCRKIN